MTTIAASTTQPRYCPYCAFGFHDKCTGQAPAHGGTCECADRHHDPEVRVAAAMRLYQNSDRNGAPLEVLATEWRARSGATRTRTA